MRSKVQKQGVNTARKRVVVALRMATSAGPQKLSGIFDFLGIDRHWQTILSRTKPEFTPDAVL